MFLILIIIAHFMGVPWTLVIPLTGIILFAGVAPLWIVGPGYGPTGQYNRKLRKWMTLEFIVISIIWIVM